MNKIFISLAIFCALSACNKKEDAAIPVAPQAAVADVSTTKPSALDVGTIEQITTTASGSGITAGAAITDALKTAIMQVNGTTIDASSVMDHVAVNATATLDVQTKGGKDYLKATETVKGEQFAESIVAQSQGMVASFKVVKLTVPSEKISNYVVEIEANIKKFKAPADNGKIKIVIAPIRSDKTSFNIGGRQVPAAEVLATMHQQIVDALSKSGRFIVLDRQFDGEIQNELDMIGSGQASNSNFAKLGQAASADLVWVGVVNNFAYDKHVRKLETSDNDLVSYSGGWSISQRIINLTTRQILQSATLQGDAPAQAASTLQTSIDGKAILNGMLSEIVKTTASEIIGKTFPITIVERDGNNVVLSQGGDAVKNNTRYAVYLLGKEIKDPQTGLTLGNVENLCCEVVINRVAQNLSYGVLENIQVKLDGVKPGSLQLREAVKKVEPKSEPKSELTTSNATTTKSNGKATNKAAIQTAPEGEAKKKDDW